MPLCLLPLLADFSNINSWLRSSLKIISSWNKKKRVNCRFPGRCSGVSWTGLYLTSLCNHLPVPTRASLAALCLGQHGLSYFYTFKAPSIQSLICVLSIYLKVYYLSRLCLAMSVIGGHFPLRFLETIPPFSLSIAHRILPRLLACLILPWGGSASGSWGERSSGMWWPLLEEYLTHRKLYNYVKIRKKCKNLTGHFIITWVS